MDVLLAHTAFEKTDAVYVLQVEVPLADNGFFIAGVSEKLDHGEVHFITLAADRRTERRLDAGRVSAEFLKFCYCKSDDAPDCALPSGMDGGNGPDVGRVEKHGHAVGGADSDVQSRRQRNDGVGVFKIRHYAV